MKQIVEQRRAILHLSFITTMNEEKLVLRMRLKATAWPFKK